jgi:uncharacterized protein (TIGR02145 family)
LDADGQVPSTNAAYGRFITIPSASPFDWRTPQNNYLWNTNTIVGDGAVIKHPVNDPCPAGWRVPSAPEFSALTNPLFNTSAWTGTGRLFTPSGGASPTLFLPAAGSRSNTGVLGAVGTGGAYWSSSWSSIYADNMSISSSAAALNITNSRAVGMSIRCVME